MPWAACTSRTFISAFEWTLWWWITNVCLLWWKLSSIAQMLLWPDNGRTAPLANWSPTLWTLFQICFRQTTCGKSVLAMSFFSLPFSIWSRIFCFFITGRLFLDHILLFSLHLRYLVIRLRLFQFFSHSRGHWSGFGRVMAHWLLWQGGWRTTSQSLRDTHFQSFIF